MLDLFGKISNKSFFEFASIRFKKMYYDVLVYGANAAGVGAAVTASSNGKWTVKVVEPLTMIGGMAAAGGVSLMNQGGCGLTGLAAKWNRLVGSYYNLSNGMPYPPFPRMVESELAMWDLLNYENSTIDVSLGCHVMDVHLPEPGCVGIVDFICDDDMDENNEIDAKSFSVHAKYVIDASYDADIMVMAGVDHASGRESRSEYNESLAGVQVKEWSDLESFARQNITIDPFHEDGSLLKYINPEPLKPAGSGDDKLMAFQFFACITESKSNRVPFYKPPKYDPKDFELLLRQTKAVMRKGWFPKGPPLSYFGDVQCYDPIVENVTGNRDCCFCCGTAPVNTDQPELNRGWASSSYAMRQKMKQAYRYYVQGSLFFMANDPRMPEYTRKDASRYGYCKDEYERFNHFPPQLYVRISNRLKGQYVLTQNNIANPRKKRDAVAMGCWVFDQHTVDRVIVKDTEGKERVRNEGFFRAEVSERGLSCNHPDANCGTLSRSSNSNTFPQQSSKLYQNQGCKDCVSGVFPWYDVPFGVMVPANRQQAYNLLVPVGISASSVAYSSARIENMFMDLGSAAGVSVAILLEQQEDQIIDHCPKLAVQDTNISAVQHVLTNVYEQKFHGPFSSKKDTIDEIVHRYDKYK